MFFFFFSRKRGISCAFMICCLLLITSRGLLWECLSSQSAGSLPFAFCSPGEAPVISSLRAVALPLSPSFYQAKSGFQEFPNQVNMNPILECISIRRQLCSLPNQHIHVNPVCAEPAKSSFHSPTKNFRLQNFGVNLPFCPLAGKWQLRTLSYTSSFFPIFKTLSIA